MTSSSCFISAYFLISFIWHSLTVFWKCSVVHLIMKYLHVNSIYYIRCSIAINIQFQILNRCRCTKQYKISYNIIDVCCREGKRFYIDVSERGAVIVILPRLLSAWWCRLVLLLIIVAYPFHWCFGRKSDKCIQPTGGLL